MDFTLEITRIDCITKEGKCSNDEIVLYITPTDNPNDQSINTGKKDSRWPNPNSDTQVVLSNANYYDIGEFDDGTSKNITNVKSYLNQASADIYLVDDDTIDWDDILGVQKVRGRIDRQITDKLLFDNWGAKYYVYYTIYPTIYTPSQASLKVSALKHSMINGAKSELVDIVMENPQVSSLSSLAKRKAREVVSSKIITRLYSEATQLENDIIDSDVDFNSADISTQLTDQLKNVGTIFTKSFLDDSEETIDDIKAAIVYSYIRKKLTPEHFGKILGILLHNDPSNPVLGKLPLSDEGRKNVCKKSSLNLEQILKSRANSILKKYKDRSNLNLDDFDKLVMQEVDSSIEMIVKELKRKVLELAKLLMFQYPTEYLKDSVSEEMVALIKNDLAKPTNQYGVLEDTSDDDYYNVKKGYGIRKGLYKLLEQSKISSIEDISAEYVPGRRGKISGLGKDIFFDIAMNAYKRLE